MKYHQLGKSSLNISRIGFGCMSLKKENADAEKILHEAIDRGINYFDTADLYDKGENEILVGKALKQHRNKIVLATKVGNEWKKDGTGWEWNPRKSYIIKAVEASLGRLQTDTIDLYQLHGGTIDDPIDETIEAFELLVQRGKIRFYGISSIRPNVIREWIRRSKIVSVMMQYSLLDRRPEESCLDLLQQNNISVLARGSVAQGLLVDKPAKPYLDYSEEQVRAAANAMRSVADKGTASQIAMKYTLAHPAVASAVVGIRTMKQLEEAAASFNYDALSIEELKRLQDVVKPNVYKEHR
jgi:aryl-alcohol dehydrogenase-like predicted oxidoreductase